MDSLTIPGGGRRVSQGMGEDTVQWDTKATGWEAEDPVFSPGADNYL